jgi:S1-C subfamily serine protease
VTLVAALCAALGLSTAAASAPGLDPEAVVRRIGPSIVVVRTTLEGRAGSVRFESGGAAFTNTGFFVGTQGEVLTSLFALAGCETPVVVTHDGQSVAARVAAVDQPSGLALLATPLTDTVPLTAAGQGVPADRIVFLAAARPQDGRFAAFLSPGFVLPERGNVRLQGAQWEALLVAAVHVRDGSAAAPLVDGEGRLVAIVLGQCAGGGVGPDGGECVALPVDRLESIVARLKSGQSRRLGWLGVAVVQESGLREGVRVEAALENSPACAAGIRAGDVLLQVDDEIVDSAAVLSRHVAEAGPGRTATLKVLRGEEIKTVSVELGARPLLICAGYRLPGEQVVRLSWPQAGRTPLSRKAMADLLRENALLRRRLRELEEAHRSQPQSPP